MSEEIKIVYEPNYEGLNVEEVIYGETENCYGKMQAYPLDIITDANDTSKTPRPVVIFVHGGAFKLPGSKRTSSVSLVGRHLVKEGYTVVAPNYPVYDNEEDRDADKRAAVMTKPPVTIKMVYDFILENAEKYGFDTKRIAIIGSSAGTLVVYTALSRYKDLSFACMCDLSGAPVDLPDISDFPPLFSIHGTADMSYVRQAPVTAAYAKAHISRTLVSLGGSKHQTMGYVDEFAPQLVNFVKFHFNKIK